MSEVNKFKDLLIYEVQKAFYDERGKGAKYRLTLTGVPYLEEQLKDKSADKEVVRDWLIENQFAKDIEIEEDTFSFSANISNCCLSNIKDYFENKGMQPLSCPIANMFMYAIEKENGLSPELLPIKFDNDCCNLTMAKIATSDVVVTGI